MTILNLSLSLYPYARRPNFGSPDLLPLGSYHHYKWDNKFWQRWRNLAWPSNSWIRHLINIKSTQLLISEYCTKQRKWVLCEILKYLSLKRDRNWDNYEIIIFKLILMKIRIYINNLLNLFIEFIYINNKFIGVRLINILFFSFSVIGPSKSTKLDICLVDSHSHTFVWKQNQCTTFQLTCQVKTAKKCWQRQINSNCILFERSYYKLSKYEDFVDIKR